MIHDGRMKDTSVKHYHIDDDEQKNKLIWKRKRPLSTAIAVLLLTLIADIFTGYSSGRRQKRLLHFRESCAIVIMKKATAHKVG